jgi:hypothetical protein
VTDNIQTIVGGNDRGIGRGYGFGANEILADPGKPVAAQSWKFRTYDRLKTDIAGATSPPHPFA